MLLLKCNYYFCLAVGDKLAKPIFLDEIVNLILKSNFLKKINVIIKYILKKI
jgi:hypothetical protein